MEDTDDRQSMSTLHKRVIDFLWSHAVIFDEVYTNITKNCNFSLYDGSACCCAMDAYDSTNTDPFDIYGPVCIDAPDGKYYPSRYGTSFSSTKDCSLSSLSYCCSNCREIRGFKLPLNGGTNVSSFPIGEHSFPRPCHSPTPSNKG